MNIDICFLWLMILVCRNIRLGGTVNEAHPFLYFSKDDMNTLRQQAKTTHAHIAKKIAQAADILKLDPKTFLPPRDWNEYSSRWNERYGNDLTALAMYIVLNEADSRARALALEYMDTLVSLTNWRVRSSLKDDVPVAHSLAGFATAFDFLYEYLSENQKAKYLSKIRDVSRELYEKSYNEWWGKTYIQNHCATNFAALLIGALVTSRHYHNEAERWIQHAHQMLNRTLFLLDFVVDGSLEEGAAYGSYTLRSLTQYIFLALRHFKIDLTRGPWLREHFWFIYHTILPGFKQTIGIADTNMNWFYGPQSQLVFLDSFVLKNGWGNWLARKIEENKLGREFGYVQASHQTNSMLHTEFLFYNASLPDMKPLDHSSSHLHVFSDWGVVVYRAGGREGTFLAFKCGLLHGMAINQIVHRKRFAWLKSWHSFNPGHEHPDQGLFVYVPKGVPFITGTLYGPKYTWLNNALTFGPSKWTHCFAPYSGQLGECHKWFNYKNDEVWNAEGEIISSSKNKDFVFVSGEMAKWYDSRMGLASVYRSVILIKPTVLLVVDHIERSRKSPLKYMSAFFHNTASSFRHDHSPIVGKSGGAHIVLNDSLHRIVWCNTFRSQQSTATIGKSSYGKKNSSFVNVTTIFPPRAQFGRVAYLFTAPGEDVEEFTAKGEHGKGVHVIVTVNSIKHKITIATKHDSPQTRFEFLGFGGFAKIETKYLVVRFGMGIVPQWNKTGFDESRRSLLISMSEFTFSGPSIFLPLAVLCVAVFFYRQLQKRVRLRSFYKKTLSLFVLLCLCLVSALVYLHSRECNIALCFSADFRKPLLREPIKGMDKKTSIAQAQLQQPPFVIYTSLPFAGVELFDVLFKNTKDFFYHHLLAQSFHGSQNQYAAKQKRFFDLCKLYEGHLSKEKEAKTSKIFRTLMESPEKILTNIPKNNLRNALPAIRLEDPGWALRIQWLQKMILKQRARVVIVIRDPRGWVHAWLKKLKNEPHRVRAVKTALDKLKQQCGQTETISLAAEFQSIQSVLLQTESGEDIEFHKVLAYIWNTYMKAVIRTTNTVSKRLLRFVRVEDLMQKAKKTANRVYKFIGIPVRPTVEHHLLQIVRTGQYRFRSSGELINARYVTAWKGGLTKKQVADIEKICSFAMEKFLYTPSDTKTRPT